MKQILLGLAALMLTAACDTKTASFGTQQHAAIEWDTVMASDRIALAPRNHSLIFMR